MKVWDEDPQMPAISESMAKSMDRELTRLRKELAIRDARLRDLSEAYVNLQQMLQDHGIRVPHRYNQ